VLRIEEPERRARLARRHRLALPAADVLEAARIAGGSARPKSRSWAAIRMAPSN
jgi:hypothetical protein